MEDGVLSAVWIHRHGLPYVWTAVDEAIVLRRELPDMRISAATIGLEVSNVKARKAWVIFCPLGHLNGGDALDNANNFFHQRDSLSVNALRVDDIRQNSALPLDRPGLYKPNEVGRPSNLKREQGTALVIIIFWKFDTQVLRGHCTLLTKPRL